MKKLVLLLITSVLMASVSALADETAQGVQTSAHGAYGDVESVKDSINEIVKSANTDLGKACSDCTYNSETHVTTCTGPKAKSAHHVDRCSAILWSQNTGGRREYKQCNEYFVSKNGQLSSAGKIIMNDIVKQVQASGYDPSMGFLRDNECLDQQPDENGKMMAVCPGFKKFDYVKRMEFYLFLMENIAFRENSCLEHPRTAKGSVTQAVCSFQLEGPAKIRKQNRHDIPSCQGSTAYIKSESGCAVCATDMMLHELNSLKNPEHTKCAPFGRYADHAVEKQYWYSTNPPPPGKKSHAYQGLISDLRWFPGCN